MSKRLDELFSPERLQQRWQRGTDSPVSDHPADVPKKIMSVPYGLEQLRQIIREQYPENGNKALNYLADQLEELLKLRFPEGKSVSEEEKKSLNIAAEQILCQIEDLAEALDIGKKEKLRAGRY